MVSTDAGRAASRALRRTGWLLHAHMVEVKLQALREAVKANFDPNQPRVPAGNPDGGQWTDGGGGTGGRLPRGPGTLLDVGDGESERVHLAQNDPPDHLSDVRPRPRKLPRTIQSPADIPKKKPDSTQGRNAIIKFVAQEVAELVIVRAAVGSLVGAEARQAVRRAVGRALIGLKVAAWVAEEGFASIVSYSDPARTLEDLRDAASGPSQPGYEIHHIVEKKSAADDGFPDSMINGPENRVRVPTFRHHQITRWFMKGNEDLGGLSPRNYLRGKGWEMRMQMGLKALIDQGVLKP